jgi:hypothetical protein
VSEATIESCSSGEEFLCFSVARLLLIILILYSSVDDNYDGSFESLCLLLLLFHLSFTNPTIKINTLPSSPSLSSTPNPTTKSTSPFPQPNEPVSAAVSSSTTPTRVKPKSSFSASWSAARARPPVRWRRRSPRGSRAREMTDGSGTKVRGRRGRRGVGRGRTSRRRRVGRSGS